MVDVPTISYAVVWVRSPYGEICVSRIVTIVVSTRTLFLSAVGLFDIYYQFEIVFLKYFFYNNFDIDKIRDNNNLYLGKIRTYYVNYGCSGPCQPFSL